MWEVVGGDVTEAIKEFFENEKLLSAINNTSLTIVPKIK